MNLAEGMLHLLAAEPTLLPEAPANASGAQIEHRRINEIHPCLRCSNPARCAYIAATILGPRWLDLCADCANWLRSNLPESDEQR